MTVFIASYKFMEVQIFEDNPATAEAFAAFFIEQLAGNERFDVALSGGSTPKLLFEILAKDYQEVDWSKVHFWWGDERCVPPTDDDSNFKMTNDRFLSRVDIPEENIHRVKGDNDPESEAIRYSQEINSNIPSHAGLPLFDLIILGMGSDGHTASIFPHQMELLTSEQVCEVATHPDSGQNRITLTGPVINNASLICFLVTGEGKAEKVEEIFKHEGEWESYPASHIQSENGKLYWFMDEKAALRIS